MATNSKIPLIAATLNDKHFIDWHELIGNKRYATYMRCNRISAILKALRESQSNIQILILEWLFNNYAEVGLPSSVNKN